MIKKLIPVLFLIPVMFGCEDSFFNPAPVTLSKKVLYKEMQEWYLWYDSMPSVDPDAYGSLTELLNAIINPKDRWTRVFYTPDYNSHPARRNEYIGHGFGMIRKDDGSVWVGFVYEDSEAESKNIERGWQLLAVNGENITPESILDSLLGKDEEGVVNLFKFKTPAGQTVETSMTKEKLDINSVLYSDVIKTSKGKAGYIVYQHFLPGSISELDTVFSRFKSEEINDIIIDLRYNPGGQLNESQHLASLVASQAAFKRTFYRLEYNAKKAAQNFTKPFLNLKYSLNPIPDRIIIITSGLTAGPAEVLINGLKPFGNVYLIGDDTSGEPVGFISRQYTDSTLLPVTYKILNNLGEGDYFEGIAADSYIQEDITIPFGNPEEKCLKEALYFIENDE